MSPSEVTLSCDHDTFIANFNAAKQLVDLDVRKILNRIYINLQCNHGHETAYRLMNNKSLKEIIDLYSADTISPIEEGEIDGMKYRIFDPPK